MSLIDDISSAEARLQERATQKKGLCLAKMNVGILSLESHECPDGLARQIARTVSSVTVLTSDTS